MMTNEISDIPPDVRKVYRRLRRWRSSHARRVPIPDALWAAAGELAREHGINRTAKALRLEYGKLKERAGVAGPAKKVVRKVPSAIPRHARRSVPAGTFMELITPRPGNSQECRVELEGPRGRMRVEFKGLATAELVALRRALWDGEAQ
jgi:hypothetical protein